MDALLESLKKLKDSITKVPSRKFKQSTLIDKQKDCNELELQLRKLTNSPQPNYEIIVKCNRLIKIIKELLQNRLKEYYADVDNSDSDRTTDSENNTDIINMANFEISVASKIVDEFDGDNRKLSTFLGTIEFYASTLKDDAQKSQLLQFILAAKVTEKVKNRLIPTAIPNSIAELKDILIKNYKLNKNPLKLQNELHQTRQGSLNVTNFATRIETIIAALNEVQISAQGENNKDIIVKLNDQLAVNAFKTGLNEPFKSVVLAAQPNTFAKALEIATEVDSQANSNYNVMTFRSRNSFNNRNYNRNNNSYRNNNTNRNNNYRNNNNGIRNNNGYRYYNNTNRTNSNNTYRNYNNNNRSRQNSGNGSSPGNRG